MKKKFMALLLTLAMVATFMPAMALTAFAKESGTVTLKYSENEGDVVTAKLHDFEKEDAEHKDVPCQELHFDKKSPYKQLDAGFHWEVNGVTVSLENIPNKEGKPTDKYKVIMDGAKLQPDNVLVKKPDAHKHEIGTAGATLKLYREARDPNCSRPGHDAVYKCNVCEKYFDSDANEIGNWNDLRTWLRKGGNGYIAPLGHDWSEEFYEVMHRGGVFHVQRCERDGCDAENRETAHRSDDKEWDVYYSNRLGEYRHDRYCSCGLRNRYSAENHAADEDIQRAGGYPAECCKDGIREYYKCMECGLYFRDAKGTDLIGDEEALEAWKKDSSEEGGLLPAFGHKWDKGVVQKDGSTLYTCTVCGATKVEKGVATGDTENMGLWMMLAVAAIVAAGYAVSRKEN